MRGRPLLHTTYEGDQAIFDTTTKKVMAGLLLIAMISIPFQVVPGLKFLGEDDWLRLLGTTAIF
ncbi:MAG: hypothetical protein WA726_08920, partial [Acidimicrobiia bacterium]